MRVTVVFGCSLTLNDTWNRPVSGSVLYQKASNLAKDDRDRRTSRDAAEQRKRDQSQHFLSPRGSTFPSGAVLTYA